MNKSIFEQLKALDISVLEAEKREKVQANIQQALDLNTDEITEEELQQVQQFYGKLKANLDSLVEQKRKDAEAERKKEEVGSTEPKAKGKSKKNSEPTCTKEEKMAKIDNAIELPHKEIADSLGITHEMLNRKGSPFKQSVSMIYGMQASKYLKKLERNEEVEGTISTIKKVSQKVADGLQAMTDEEVEAFKEGENVKVSKSAKTTESEEQPSGEYQDEGQGDEGGEGERGDDSEYEDAAPITDEDTDESTDEGAEPDETTEDEGGAYKNPLLKGIFGV